MSTAVLEKALIPYQTADADPYCKLCDVAMDCVIAKQDDERRDGVVKSGNWRR